MEDFGTFVGKRARLRSRLTPRTAVLPTQPSYLGQLSFLTLGQSLSKSFNESDTHIPTEKFPGDAYEGEIFRASTNVSGAFLQSLCC